MSEIEMLVHEVRELRANVATLLRQEGVRLTKNQLAQRLGVSRRTLYNRIASGAIPWPKSDGEWLLAEVIAWENQTKAAPRSGSRSG